MMKDQSLENANVINLFILAILSQRQETDLATGILNHMPQDLRLEKILVAYIIQRDNNAIIPLSGMQ